MRILVTGVLGFIGSNFARLILDKTDHSVIGFARNSDQKNYKRIEDFANHERFHLKLGDLSSDISELAENIDVICNFAAKTFVDHSVRDPKPFINNNIIGTYNLLEQARMYGPKLYIQVSTDEVYGSILEGVHDEKSMLNPGNPYSASKASADMLCLSYYNTYGIPIIITRTENCYGRFQHPQKAIPVWTKKALNGEPIPLYGDGMHIRQWLNVLDHCFAIMFLIEKGKPGEIYHIAGNEEKTNLEMVNKILEITGSKSDINFIPDEKIRPGHDRRYAINSNKLRSLGWTNKYTIETGIEYTVNWFKHNQWWFF